ncbi:MAG: lysostaphin resistance A-like protein [Victivallaceae bacterium]|nr:type II CAAX endopeptidase family protein [Victivallaceae bacterium]MEA5098487.1 type II CAAX endopeptidase family protein [Burkholderiaceae bacterium]
MRFAEAAGRIAVLPGMRGILPFMPFMVLAAVNYFSPAVAYGAAAICCFFLISPFAPVKPEWPAYFAWNRVNWRWLPWVATGLFLLSIGLTKLIFSVIIRSNPEMQPLLRELIQLRGWRLTLFFFIVTVPVPLIEEWVFRHYLFGGLVKWLGWIGAATATSLIFAAMHLYWPIMPGLFLLGMAWQLIYLRSGSLGYAVLLHSGNNAITMLIALLTA